jgi:hypothetical protein
MATIFSAEGSGEYPKKTTDPGQTTGKLVLYVLVNYKKDALDSQPQVMKFTSCLPRVGGFLRVLPASFSTKNCRHDTADYC